ncbi:unnamed protein product [Cyprideis torosa]|uniref:Uncharacterized protein n=1 Tax=Cyprideis torosa TaxID=163714 RepID=A0A7R8ZI80_9CRUS|nr:unnamed protein product [Cyprideis torosa]CAG0884229.1 unnamed protein product [Cyprideis torosa]
MTDVVRDNIQIARGELGTNTMDLLKKIGHNFHVFFNDENMSGNWSTYAYDNPLDRKGAIQLCTTLERDKEVPNDVRVRFGLREMIEGYTTWVIKVVPPDSAIHLFQEGDSSSRIWNLNPGDFFTVSIDIEEFQFLNTRTSPCESDPFYSYHQCITQCATDQWMDPKTWSDLKLARGIDEELHYPCQIFGFDQDPKLPPCKSIDHELYAMNFFVASGIYDNVRSGGCLQRCLKPCRRLKYTFHQEKTETNFASKSAMLEIRSVQSLRPVFKEVWNYEFGQMVAEIGGNLGMFLGFSFLGSVGWILQDKLRKMVG